MNIKYTMSNKVLNELENDVELVFKQAYRAAHTHIRDSEDDIRIGIDGEVKALKNIFQEDIYSDDVPTSLPASQSVISLHNTTSQTIWNSTVWDQSLSSITVQNATGALLPLTFYNAIYLNPVHPNKSQAWWLLDGEFVDERPENNYLSHTIPSSHDSANKSTFEPILERWNGSRWIREMPRNESGLNWYIDSATGIVQFYQTEASLNALNINAIGLMDDVSFSRPRLSFIKYDGPKGAGGSIGNAPNSNYEEYGNYYNDSNQWIAKTSTTDLAPYGSDLRVAAQAKFRLFAEYSDVSGNLLTQELILLLGVVGHRDVSGGVYSEQVQFTIESNLFNDAPLIENIRLYAHRNPGGVIKSDYYMYVDINKTIVPSPGMLLTAECYDNNHGDVTDGRRLWQLNDGTLLTSNSALGMSELKRVNTLESETVTYAGDNVIINKLNGENPALYEEYVFDDANLAVGDWISLMQVGDGVGDGSLRADALFVLEDRSSGGHHTLKFHAKFKHGKCLLEVISSNFYSADRIDGLRVVGKRVYDGGILQVRLSRKTGNDMILRVYENLNTKGWVSLVGEQKNNTSPNPDNTPTVYTNNPTRPVSSVYSGFGNIYPATELTEVTVVSAVSKNAIKSTNADIYYHESDIDIYDGSLDLSGSNINMNNGSNIDMNNNNILSVNETDITLATITTAEVDRITRITGSGGHVKIGTAAANASAGQRVEVTEPLVLYTGNNGVTNINYKTSLSFSLPEGSVIYDARATSSGGIQLPMFKRDFDTTNFRFDDRGTLTGYYALPTDGWALSSPYTFKLVTPLGLRHTAEVITGNGEGIYQFVEGATAGTASATTGRYSSSPNPFCLVHPMGDWTLWHIFSAGQSELLIMRAHKAWRQMIIREVQITSYSVNASVNNTSTNAVDIDFEIWVGLLDKNAPNTNPVSNSGNKLNTYVAVNNSLTYNSCDAHTFLWDVISTANGGSAPNNCTQPWQHVPNAVWDNDLTNPTCRRIKVNRIQATANTNTVVRDPWIEGVKNAGKTTGVQNAVTSIKLDLPLYCPKDYGVGVWFVERCPTTSQLTSGSKVTFGAYSCAHNGFNPASAPYQVEVLAEMNMQS